MSVISRGWVFSMWSVTLRYEVTVSRGILNLDMKMLDLLEATCHFRNTTSTQSFLGFFFGIAFWSNLLTFKTEHWFCSISLVGSSFQPSPPALPVKYVNEAEPVSPPAHLTSEYHWVTSIHDTWNRRITSQRPAGIYDPQKWEIKLNVVVISH